MADPDVSLDVLIERLKEIPAREWDSIREDTYTNFHSNIGNYTIDVGSFTFKKRASYLLIIKSNGERYQAKGDPVKPLFTFLSEKLSLRQEDEKSRKERLLQGLMDTLRKRFLV